MKKYQLWIVFALCLALLTGCFGNGDTQPSTTDSQNTTGQTTESTAPAWPGYVDHKTEYTYYHTETRAVKWEEDVVYLANSMLKNHPLLRNREFLIEMPNYETDSRNFFDAALLEEFIKQINLLIPELAELSDEEIYYRLHWIFGLFQDVHTRLEHYGDAFYPIIFMNFYEYGEINYYAVMVDSQHEELLFARLEAINGYSVEEVTAMIKPFTAMETEYGLTDWLSKGGMGASLLSEAGMLRAAGIIGAGNEVTYTLIAMDGQTHHVTLTPFKNVVDWKGLSYMQVHFVPYADYETEFYWFTEDLMEDSLYVRLNTFREDPQNTYQQFSNGLFQTYRAHGRYHKVIVDLRGNGGGSQGTGFDVMIRELVKMECDEFYVLVDGGSYSMATIFAGELVARRGDVILAGTPAGEAAGFFAGIYSEEFVMPNCGVEFTMPTTYYQPFPAGEDNRIVPDLLIYPTLAEYMNGIDTVLYQVLFQ